MALLFEIEEKGIPDNYATLRTWYKTSAYTGIASATLPGDLNVHAFQQALGFKTVQYLLETTRVGTHFMGSHASLV